MSANNAFTQEGTIDPGAYRTIDELVRSQTKGKGSIAIVNVKSVDEGEKELA
jgi:hypothetical protein